MASSRAHGIQSEDFQAAIAKAVELRTLHAALLQRSNLGSPAVLGPPLGPSPPVFRRSTPPPSAEDYPVFTPSYEEEPTRGYQYLRPEHRSLSETWRAINLGDGKKDAAVNLGRSEHSTPCSERNILFRNEHFSKRSSSCTNHLVRASPSADPRISSSSRTSPGFETITTCNSCKPATINRESETEFKNSKTTAASFETLRDPELPIDGHAKHRGQILSWLFPKSKRKPKQEEMSPNPNESEDMSQILKNWGLLSVDSLKMELLEANRKRDAALAQVSEMRSSLGDLNQKLVRIETYCEELKKALKQSKHARNSEAFNRPSLSSNSEISSGNGSMSNNSSMPVTNEVMVEGFLQIVSESRLSVKQFCKMLINYIKEADCDLMENLNSLIQPLQTTDATSNYSRLLLYHVEALINRCLYQDFENCMFRKDGSPNFLDPQQDRRDKFSSFIALRNLSWNEVLRKGTKFYSEEFSRFCDQKMSCIGSLLSWSRPWPEQILQCFFVAAKCIWLLHLLAFSFSTPVRIMRVAEAQKFDPHYMDDIVLDRKRTGRPAGVTIMVAPGFYIEDEIMKCRVLQRY